MFVQAMQRTIFQVLKIRNVEKKSDKRWSDLVGQARFCLLAGLVIEDVWPVIYIIILLHTPTFITTKYYEIIQNITKSKHLKGQL